MNENLQIKGSADIGPHLANFDPTDRNWTQLIFQPEKPIIEGELNLLQTIQNQMLRRALRAQFSYAGLIADISPSSAATNEVTVTTAGESFSVAVDGILTEIKHYDARDNSSDKTANRIPLTNWGLHTGDNPGLGGAFIDNLYLELWFEEVMSPDGDAASDGFVADAVVYDNGSVSDWTLANDIKINEVPLPETSRRVQLRYRWVVFNVPIGSPTVDLTGRNPVASIDYTYTLANDGVHFVAGDGSLLAAKTLNSVEGKVYALPILSIFRSSDTVSPSSIGVYAPVLTVSTSLNDFFAPNLPSVGRLTLFSQGLYLQGILGTTNTLIQFSDSDGNINYDPNQKRFRFGADLVDSETQLKANEFELDGIDRGVYGITGDWDSTFAADEDRTTGPAIRLFSSGHSTNANLGQLLNGGFEILRWTATVIEAQQNFRIAASKKLLFEDLISGSGEFFPSYAIDEWLVTNFRANGQTNAVVLNSRNVFHGYVQWDTTPNGGDTFLPTGFTASYTSGNSIRVTHNLGLTTAEAKRIAATINTSSYYLQLDNADPNFFEFSLYERTNDTAVPPTGGASITGLSFVMFPYGDSNW